MTAFLSDGVPPAAVYLVWPLLIAAIAASLMNWGVSKSGSPAPRPMMSLPSDLRRAALAVTAMVGEGLIAFRRCEMKLISISGVGIPSRTLYNLRFHAGRHASRKPIP